MTYDWNTMVPITVPVGLNGWNYTGEVTINGQKVSFPVGKPTTVPEPVAEMLKAMIEREQENAGNTAKPNNHYIGDVTIPAGKSLTIAKGAEIVDENNAPTVILPETELTMIAENAAFAFMAINAMPEKGKTYTLTYNGVAYDSVCSTWFDGANTQLVMGNSEIVDGGNPDAPFAVMFYAIPQEIDEIGTVCGVVQCMDSPTSVTLSIVEKVETASTSAGGFIVKATVGDDGSSCTFNKTYAETLAAIDAGRYVACHLPDGEGVTIMPALATDPNDTSPNISFGVYLNGMSLMLVMNYDGTGEFHVLGSE